MWCEDEEFAVVRWRLISEYIRLEPVGPMIEGNLVLQGVALSAEYGPVLATVEFAADHEEDYAMVGKVVPWEMLMTPPVDEHSGPQFVIPISLGANLEGTVCIKIYVDRLEKIPYEEENKESYDISSPFIQAISYVNRVGGQQNLENASGSAENVGDDVPVIATALCVVHNAEEREAKEKEGFELGTALNIASEGISLVDSSDFPFVLGVSHAPVTDGVSGIEDAVFVQSDTKDAMPVAPQGYDLVADLSQSNDDVSVIFIVPRI